MVNVGGTHYSRIEGVPPCAVAACRKRAERKGGVVTSAYCLEHTRNEIHRLITSGKTFAEARQEIWVSRPVVRLTFVS